MSDLPSSLMGVLTRVAAGHYAGFVSLAGETIKLVARVEFDKVASQPCMHLEVDGVLEGALYRAPDEEHVDWLGYLTVRGVDEGRKHITVCGRTLESGKLMQFVIAGS